MPDSKSSSPDDLVIKLKSPETGRETHVTFILTDSKTGARYTPTELVEPGSVPQSQQPSADVAAAPSGDENFRFHLLFHEFDAGPLTICQKNPDGTVTCTNGP